MKILICVVSYNRKNMTELCIESLVNTTNAEHYIVVVDNGSTDGSREWLKEKHNAGWINKLILPNENYWAGKALNVGFEEGLKEFDADILMRSDNDIYYRWRWDSYVELAFDSYPELMNLGLMDLSDFFFFTQIPTVPRSRGYVPINMSHVKITGGAYAFRRQIWDEGIRHVEMGWDDSIESAEDLQFCVALNEKGYEWGHVMSTVAIHMGIYWGFEPKKEMSNYEYYKHSWESRFGKETFYNLDTFHEVTHKTKEIKKKPGT